MRRLGILVAALIAATTISLQLAEAQSQQPGVSRKYDPAQGWWRSFLPAETKSRVRAPAAETGTVTQNITSESARPEPAASNPKETVEEKATTAKAPAKKRRTQSARRTKKKSTRSARATEPASSRKRSSEEARWWEETGNPAVFAFSTCVAEYASAATREGKEAPHAEFVTQAMAGPCKEPFDHMAGILLKRHGEKGFARVSKELIETTFIPSVRGAVEKTMAEVRRDEKQRAALGIEVQKTKDAMFACFVREADRLAAESTAEAHAVGEAVIAACRKEADQFFAKLDELYPDVSAGALSTRQTALSHSYLPAIQSRVAAVRAASAQAAQ